HHGCGAAKQDPKPNAALHRDVALRQFALQLLFGFKNVAETGALRNLTEIRLSDVSSTCRFEALSAQWRPTRTGFPPLPLTGEDPSPWRKN
ncbi:hypothetical protein, partial [Salmonella enterica]|uniref:hypothetical protein n=1 Tax=Salmonella enterica TaxID=28901 RepID=UPI003D2ACC93